MRREKGKREKRDGGRSRRSEVGDWRSNAGGGRRKGE